MNLLAFLKKPLLTVLLGSFALFANAQSTTGSIAADAVKLDVDHLDSFQDGFAVIRKGTSVALINDQGAIVVPFNKYHSISPMTNGYAVVILNSQVGTAGLIDKHGKEVLPCTFYSVSPVDKNGYAIAQESFSGGGKIVHLQTGKTYIHKNSLSSKVPHEEKLRPWDNFVFNHGLAAERDAKTNQYGYVNWAGDFVIAPQFKDAQPFFQGMAAVSKQDEFGQTKYGFIDTTGSFIIGPQFSRKPGNFYKNRSYVIPKDPGEFRAAYIDRTGAIIIKLKEYSTDDDFVEDWVMARNNSKGTIALIDTAGNIFPLPRTGDFHGVEYGYTIDPKIMNGQIMIRRKAATVSNNQGLMGTDGKILAPPVFFELHYFDPVSNLARARFNSPEGTLIDGYIDRSGVFTIINVQASNW